MRRLSLLVLLLAPLLLADAPTCPPNYSYAGFTNPSQWQYVPEWHCGSEPMQSPIDIRPPFATERGKPITIDYKTTAVTVKNSGHDFRVIPKQPNSISVDGVEATLDNFHFHTPAEHTMFGRKRMAGEIHFVHKDANGKVFVIAVLLDVVNARNAALEPILRELPIQLCGSKEATIALATLLPKTITSYYRYVGSLTTPACDGDVTFFVLRSPMPISERQRRVLRTFGDNARPLQERHDRPIASVLPAR